MADEDEQLIVPLLGVGPRCGVLVGEASAYAAPTGAAVFERRTSRSMGPWVDCGEGAPATVWTAGLRGPYADVIPKLNLPASFVILDRVVWAMSALLGKLGAHGPWRGILLEYRRDAPPATPLGELEQAWTRAHRHH